MLAGGEERFSPRRSQLPYTPRIAFGGGVHGAGRAGGPAILPPGSVSCRNLLIYLLPEAQAKVVALFHFALKQGGVLLLGTSETDGILESRFEIVYKKERIYRRIRAGASPANSVSSGFAVTAGVSREVGASPGPLGSDRAGGTVP